MITVLAKSIAKEDKISEIIELSVELVEATRKEEGCISYELYQNVDDPSVFTMIEQWKDMDAFNKHGKSQHVERIVPELNKLRKEKAVVSLFNDSL